MLQVLLEFKEYATEVDVDFVRKAVRAIGRCAIKLERAAERCISVLLELIKIKVNYVVQEAIIVIKDIFRRYPNTLVSISVIIGVRELESSSIHLLILFSTFVCSTAMSPLLLPYVRA